MSAAEINRCDGEGPASIGVDGFSASRTDTASAFLAAPAVPAALVASLLALAGAHDGGIVGLICVLWFSFLVLALGGYLSALLLGVPVYLLFFRGRPVPLGLAVPIGGGIAGAPWSALSLLSHEPGVLLFAAFAAALGCVGGMVFSVVRDGSPRRTRS